MRAGYVQSFTELRMLHSAGERGSASDGGAGLDKLAEVLHRLQKRHLFTTKVITGCSNLKLPAEVRFAHARGAGLGAPCRVVRRVCRIDRSDRRSWQRSRALSSWMLHEDLVLMQHPGQHDISALLLCKTIFFNASVPADVSPVRRD